MLHQRPVGAWADRIGSAALGSVLLVSLMAPPWFAGRAGAWAFPPDARLDGVGLIAAGGVTAVLVAGLYALDAVRRRCCGALRSGLAALAICVAMALVFDAVGPMSRIGDWDWVLWTTENGRLFGRWYGATALYGGFHRVARLFGAEPLASVRLCSAVCGAATAYVFTRLAAALQLPRVLRTWPFLYAGAFGAVGVGLAHVEIYSAVALILALALWLGVEAATRPTAPRLLWFSAAVTVALVTHASGILLLPAWAGLLVWVASKHRSRATLLAAVAAGALLPVSLVALALLGPPAEQGGFWSAWIPGTGGVTSDAPANASLVWPLIPALLRPDHWFSAWHLRDAAQEIFLDDRAGIVLIGALLPFALARAALPRAVWFLGAAALTYAAYAFVGPSVRPQPWDWDVRSHAAVVSCALASAVLVASATRRRYGVRFDVLLIAVALCAQWSGMVFLRTQAREPSAWGPIDRGLALAVTPLRLEIGDDGLAREPVWFWIYNSTGARVALHADRLRYQWRNADTHSFAYGWTSRKILGRRTVEPFGFACLADVRRVVVPLAAPWNSLNGTFRALLSGDRGAGLVVLESNPIEIVHRRAASLAASSE